MVMFPSSTEIYNIRTLSVNIKFICTSFRNRQNSEPWASFSGLFPSEYKWILYLTTMYVYCVYPAMSKKSENFYKCCQGCLLRGPRYISTSFILVCAPRCTGYQESLIVGWKVYSSSTNKANIYSYSIFVQEIYWLQDKITS